MLYSQRLTYSKSQSLQLQNSMTMTSKFHHRADPSFLAQVRKSWEKIGECGSCWENVGGCQIISVFLRYFDTNLKFTSMSKAKNISKRGRSLCYLMSSSWGMLLRNVQPMGSVVTGLCKSIKISVYHYRKAYQSVQCRSTSFILGARFKLRSLTRKNFKDMNRLIHPPFRCIAPGRDVPKRKFSSG